MTTLVVGASGATGRLLVAQLLDRGQPVKVVVRSPASLPDAIKQHPALTIVHASLLDLSDAELAHLVQGCNAIASCLGHNLTLKGIYGAPRRLVTDAVRRLCQAVLSHQPQQPIRFVLMNTAGNQNRDLDEPLSVGERCMLSLIRLLLPPHTDNEMAADYLQEDVSKHSEAIEWVVVRPDTLHNGDSPTGYEAHPSPTRSAIFSPGKTARSTVACFMADLITGDEPWQTWQGKMPVVYDKGFS